MSEYTHGGWMPPQLPSASWCSRIQPTSRRRDASRPGWTRRRSYCFWSRSAHANGPLAATRRRRHSVPGSTSSCSENGSGRRGRREITMSSGAIVPRAQQAKSYRLSGIDGGSHTSSGGMLGTPSQG